MRKTLIIAVVTIGLTWLVFAPAALAGSHRLGVGANYWKTVNNVKVEDVKNIDEAGLSWLASYQYAPAGLFKLEIDLEYYPELAGEKTLWSPEAFVLVGGTLYAGAGVGIYYSDGVFNNSPFFMLRAGLDFAILPFLSLDINANYRFNDWDTFDTSDLDTDTIRLGAALRFSL
jgi:opacity protein-like surface antigen